MMMMMLLTWLSLNKHEITQIPSVVLCRDITGAAELVHLQQLN